MKRDTTMLPSMREDCLEAIQLFFETRSRFPTLPELAAALARPESEIRDLAGQLAASGDIDRSGDRLIALTEQGRAIGTCVLKKHETLQCFLSEMLGMDTSAASHEACTLEHTVSDETIDRLGEYLRRPRSDAEGPGCVVPECPGKGAGGDPESCTQFSILDFNEGDELVVRCILGQSCAKRLMDLGVVPGEHIRIRRKLANRSIVLQVKGCDVAISPEIAAAVSVERSP
jgi:DtxR family transcriptional regulator, Mn-dependent transcriptional regulator